MKSISMFLLMAALVSSPTIVAAEPQITEVAGAESHIYKRASETDLYVHLFFPEGHNKQKDRSPLPYSSLVAHGTVARSTNSCRMRST